MSSLWTRLPLHWIIRRAARSQGFLDPLEIMARLRGLAQPSEVSEPVELLRAGVVFHARGLINSKVIQNNLDWVWPYWVRRQYDPRDAAFLPRAFSITHVNLTHRNWTAVGVPGHDALPIVDPRGLVTPHLDGWSIDAWVLGDDGDALIPARCEHTRQSLELATDAEVVTRSEQRRLSLESRARVVIDCDGRVRCALELRAAQQGVGEGRLVVSLRPYNPEGVARIHTIALEGNDEWRIDGRPSVGLSSVPDRHVASTYREGDVLFSLDDGDGAPVECEAGLASAAAVYKLSGERRIELTIPLDPIEEPTGDASSLAEITAGAARLRCPQPEYEFLFDAAVASLVLHAPGDVYPGPYTYRRFWFRDAALILHATLCIGLEDLSERALARFFARQTRRGYFRSQEGEWDSNGEVLWILERYRTLTGRELPDEWLDAIARGARWIERKRQDDQPPSPHAGLMPAGFSAEHLGPNDYYYWDDFWSIAGLESAGRLLREHDPHGAERARTEAHRLRDAVDRSLEACRQRLGRDAMPAAPYRRLDAGAIGSLAASYPLGLMGPQDPRVLDCAHYLLDHCCVDEAFFQDMVHSGYNAYLTLHLAQVLLRAGDERYLALVDRVAALASPTGQWPEAIHPATEGGCMGDGQHVWASAEWVLMIRHLFLREEEDALILCPGIPGRWLDARETLAFGPTATRFGPVTVTLQPLNEGAYTLVCQGSWRGEAPTIRCALPGFRVAAETGEGLLLEAEDAALREEGEA
ncbi:MAG: hypothetical protein V2I82_08215 [Halieaceae bacterium]|jgi:hypothetical protein|nr:hypothetical protein [Halieaceae bacterium]